MQPFRCLLDALRFQPLRHWRSLVILRDEHDSARDTFPLRRKGSRDRLHAVLVAAAVADQHDPPEAVRLQRRADVRQQRLKRLLAQADRSRIQHVQRRRLDIAFRHELHDRRDERIAQLPRDRLRRPSQNDIVLSCNEVRPVLLDAASRHDHRVLSGLQRVADFHPSQVFDEHRIDRRNRPRRVRIRPNWVWQGSQPAGQKHR